MTRQEAMLRNGAQPCSATLLALARLLALDILSAPFATETVSLTEVRYADHCKSVHRTKTNAHGWYIAFSISSAILPPFPIHFPVKNLAMHRDLPAPPQPLDKNHPHRR